MRVGIRRPVVLALSVRRPVVLALGVCAATAVLALAPAPAEALNPVKPLCTVAGLISGLVGKACGALQNGGKLLSAGKQLLSGHLTAAAKALAGESSSKIGPAVGLTAVVAWALGGAKAGLIGTAKLLGHSTDPQLRTTWFSATYWRMAELAAVLTLPFLFAAAIQAVASSDLAMLLRAAFGYLPLALLMVGIAAPLTMLLLAASDQMCSIVSAAAGGDGARSLLKLGGAIGALSLVYKSAFLSFLLGLLVAIGALVLWLELLIREAAVYVVVLMLPLAFAALVWPARRIWAIRAVEMLIALILAKFVIVAVVTLAAAGIGHSLWNGPSSILAGLALVTMAAFAPWALVRLLPMAEVASATAGSIRREGTGLRAQGDAADGTAQRGAEKLRERDAAARNQNGDGADAARAVKERLGDGVESGVPVAAVTGNGHGRDAPDAAPAPAADQHAPDAAPAPAPDQPQERPRRERSPGMPAIYQHPDWGGPDVVGGPQGVPSEGAVEDADPLPPTEDSDEGLL